jgi:D-serine deaminase-like pyridoxal phosphate-dependent protein
MTGRDCHPWYKLAGAPAIASPALLFYRERVVRNINHAVAIAGSADRLCPHVKTHKSPEVVGLQRSLGISRFKCATVAEADMLAECGAESVCLAYPLVGPNIDRFLRLVSLYPKTRFSVIADNLQPLRDLSAACVRHDTSIPVLLDLDVGMHRTGVPVEDAPALYRAVADLPGLIPGGLHAYDGHTHHTEYAERLAAATVTWEAVAALRSELVAGGMPVPRLLMGGTPTFPCYASFPEAELTPGTFVLHDWGYLHALPDLGFEPAALLLTRVVSAPAPGLRTLDLGTKAIASDPAGTRGIILGFEEAQPVLQNEEHWVFRFSKGSEPSVGEELYVMPTHICPTCALHAEAYFVEADGKCGGRAHIRARDRALHV